MLVHRVRVFSTRTTDGSLHLKPHILNTTCLHLCWCRVATHINAFHCTWNLDKTTSDMEKCNWTANPSRSSKSGTRSRVYIYIHWWHHSSMAAHLLNDYFFNSAAVVACEVGKTFYSSARFPASGHVFPIKCTARLSGKHLETGLPTSEIAASTLHRNAAGMTCSVWNRRGFLDRKPTGFFNWIIAGYTSGKQNSPGNQKLTNDQWL